MNSSIDDIARRYLKLGLGITLAVAALAVAVLAGSPWWSAPVLGGVVTGAVFSAVAVVAYEMAWRSIARTSGQALAKFYLAAPVVRLLAAVAVLFVFYLLHRDDLSAEGQGAGRRLMLGFTVVFFTFYVVLMIFDCIYFARVERSNKIK